MTNNPTIDGVSRELIKDMHEHPDCPVEFIDHLRRLLDAPAVERQECDYYEKIGNAISDILGGRTLTAIAALRTIQALESDPKPLMVTFADHKKGLDAYLEQISALQSTIAQLQARVAELESGRGEPFQLRVQPWMMDCFGPTIAGDREERNHRFLEEALELVQACGASANEAHQLVDYVYGRPVGEPTQEVGGVMVTLAALCLANGMDMHAAAETELDRIWTKVEQIRAKQAAKPAMSPLPGAYPDRAPPAPVAVVEKYDDVLQPFLSLMRAELHANAHKGDRPGWLQMDRKTAVLEVFYHLGKLHQAVHRDEAAAIKEYAADVANMCMMLVDVCACLDATAALNKERK